MSPTKPDRPVINLDSVLASRTPSFELGGIVFEGRPLSWVASRTFDQSPTSKQVEMLVDALRSRADDPELVTQEWVDEHLSLPSIELLVRILFRGERPDIDAPAVEPNRAARRAR